SYPYLTKSYTKTNTVLFPLLSTLHSHAIRFPYTTLFRSADGRRGHLGRDVHAQGRHVLRRQRDSDRRGRHRPGRRERRAAPHRADRKSTRLNSSHVKNSYAVFCLKKKTVKTIKIFVL